MFSSVLSTPDLISDYSVAVVLLVIRAERCPRAAQVDDRKWKRAIRSMSQPVTLALLRLVCSPIACILQKKKKRFDRYSRTGCLVALHHWKLFPACLWHSHNDEFLTSPSSPPPFFPSSSSTFHIEDISSESIAGEVKRNQVLCSSLACLGTGNTYISTPGGKEANGAICNMKNEDIFFVCGNKMEMAAVEMRNEDLQLPCFLALVQTQKRRNICHDQAINYWDRQRCTLPNLPLSHPPVLPASGVTDTLHRLFYFVLKHPPP